MACSATTASTRSPDVVARWELPRQSWLPGPRSWLAADHRRRLYARWGPVHTPNQATGDDAVRRALSWRLRRRHRRHTTHRAASQYVGMMVPAAIAIAPGSDTAESGSRPAHGEAKAVFGTVVALLIFVPVVISTCFSSPEMRHSTRPGPTVRRRQDHQAAATGPLFMWQMRPAYVLADRTPASSYPHIWGRRLPGYTNAERVQEACRKL